MRPAHRPVAATAALVTLLGLLAGLAPAAAAAAASQPRLAATSTLTLACTQTSSGRASSRRRVDGNVTTAGQPSNITVTRVATGNVEIFSASPQFVANYSGGYFKRTYGLDAWLLGTVNTGYPPATYYLLLPLASPPGSPSRPSCTSCTPTARRAGTSSSSAARGPDRGGKAVGSAPRRTGLAASPSAKGRRVDLIP